MSPFFISYHVRLAPAPDYGRNQSTCDYGLCLDHVGFEEVEPHGVQNLGLSQVAQLAQKFRLASAHCPSATTRCSCFAGTVLIRPLSKAAIGTKSQSVA